MYHWLQESISPGAVALTAINILFFMLVSMWFFVEVLSVQLEHFLVDKMQIVVIMTKHDEHFAESVKDYVRQNAAEIERTKAEAAKQHDERYDVNIKAMKERLVVYPAFMGLVIIVSVFMMFRPGGPGITKSEIALLVLTFLAFVVEVIFYFVIVRRWAFIADIELERYLFNAIVPI